MEQGRVAVARCSGQVPRRNGMMPHLYGSEDGFAHLPDRQWLPDISFPPVGGYSQPFAGGTHFQGDTLSQKPVHEGIKKGFLGLSVLPLQLEQLIIYRVLILHSHMSI